MANEQTLDERRRPSLTENVASDMRFWCRLTLDAAAGNVSLDSLMKDSEILARIIKATEYVDGLAAWRKDRPKRVREKKARKSRKASRGYTPRQY